MKSKSDVEKCEKELLSMLDKGIKYYHDHPEPHAEDIIQLLYIKWKILNKIKY